MSETCKDIISVKCLIPEPSPFLTGLLRNCVAGDLINYLYAWRKTDSINVIHIKYLRKFEQCLRKETFGCKVTSSHSSMGCYIALIKSSNIYINQTPIIEKPIIGESSFLLSLIDKKKVLNPEYRHLDTCFDCMSKEETLSKSLSFYGRQLPWAGRVTSCHNNPSLFWLWQHSLCHPMATHPSLRDT